MTDLVAEVEVIFGSASRGDADQYSDRDILISDDSIEILRERSQQLRASGWSVASYTWSKLRRLSENGALFIQHLKSEGRVTHDKYKRFQFFLHSFKPKETYKLDIVENSELAKLASQYPDSDIGALWAADLLFVTLRNYGVLRLAEDHIYEFSFNTILDSLSARGILSKDECVKLVELRKIKHYRRSEYFSIQLAEDARRIFKTLPSNVFTFDCKSKTPEDLLKIWRPLGTDVPPYHRVRNVEKLLVTASSIDQNITERDEFKTIRGWIENPRAYAFSLAQNEEKIEEVIRKSLRLTHSAAAR